MTVFGRLKALHCPATLQPYITLTEKIGAFEGDLVSIETDDPRFKPKKRSHHKKKTVECQVSGLKGIRKALLSAHTLDDYLRLSFDIVLAIDERFEQENIMIK